MRITNPILRDDLDYIRTGGVSMYLGADNSTVLGTVAIAANVLDCYPFVVRKGFAIDRISVEVTTLAIGLMVVGLYTNTLGTLYPDQLLVQSDEINTSTTGQKITVIDTTLRDDTLYWAAFNANATPTLRSMPTSGLKNVLGRAAVANATMNCGWTVALAYNVVLPTTYTAGGTIKNTNTLPPAISVRAT